MVVVMNKRDTRPSKGEIGRVMFLTQEFFLKTFTFFYLLNTNQTRDI